MSPDPVNPEDISAPRSNKNIVDEIADYLKERDLDMKDFEVVDGALQAVWPEMYNEDHLATLLVTINVYIALAERHDFEVQPTYLKMAKMEGLI